MPQASSIEEVLERADAPDAPPAPQLLEQLLEAAPERFLLTDQQAFDLATRITELLLRLFPDPAQLAELEGELAARKPAAPIAVQLAVKLARSKRLVEGLTGPLFVTVIFAVYKERVRVLAHTEHPDGEDFLARKLEQLDWLLGNRDDADYELLVVDDGCPEDSGRAVLKRARELGRDDRMRLLKLADAIHEGLAVTRPLTSPDDSRKGGSILYGMWEATRSERPGHVVIFTDADLSTHLGQVGLLLAPIQAGALAAVASRREPTSVVIKEGVRNDRGKLFIYLWKRLLPALSNIVDTQCGFKAFDARAVPALVSDSLEKRFAFDIELMLRAELQRAGSIERVAIAWIDSEAQSTTTDIQPYLSMLKAAVAMYRHYLPPSEEAEPFARLLEELDEPRWQKLVEHIPTELTDREPAQFGAWAGVSAEELAERSR